MENKNSRIDHDWRSFLTEFPEYVHIHYSIETKCPFKVFFNAHCKPFWSFVSFSWKVYIAKDKGILARTLVITTKYF